MMATATISPGVKDIGVYEQFGVLLPEECNASGQLVCDCPFCEKERHFYINSNDGRYQCKVCQRSGNRYSFIREIYEQALAATSKQDLRPFSKARKTFPVTSFIDAGVAYFAPLKRYIYPIRNKKGGYVDLCTYSVIKEGKNYKLTKAYHCSGAIMHLGGLDKLQSSGPIFICEGPHDAASLGYAIKRMKRPPAKYTVLWAPGAGAFGTKSVLKDCQEHLKGREVYILFDHDEAGMEGMKRAGKELCGICSAVYILAWPVNDDAGENQRFPEGYDIDDLVRDCTVPYDDLMEELYSWCFQYARGAEPGEGPPKLKRDKIEQVIKDFQKTGVSMYPGLIDAMKISLAVAYSIRMGGDPIWLYLIGVPGAGKSLILESMLGSHWCVYRTSVTCKSFLSGFRGDGDDNGLLNVIPGRCLVVKDYSNVISLPQAAQDELVSMLRDAFDGKVIRNYGNHVHREYPPPDSDRPDCRFSFVAGVTKEIHVHATSGLGERFLKFDIPHAGRDDIAAIRAALDDKWDSHKQALFRAASISAFLSREVDVTKPPTLPKWYMTRLEALIQIVGLARTKVSRTSGDLDYDPEPESGTRVAKTLKKLSQSLCWVLNKPIADKEVYRLVRLVAWNTSHSWRRTLYYRAWELGEFTVNELSDASSLSLSATFRHVGDMHALGILRRVRTEKPARNGTKPIQVWALTKRCHALFDAAKMGELQC